MLPVVALIGRPNVGKSTLFNRLTRTRDALVADYPGLTRDRQYGYGRVGPVPYIVIDTGGIAGGEEGISELMAAQTITALKEADAAIVMVDGRSGLTAADEFVADLARRHARSAWLVANKSEGLDAAIATAEFHALGLGEPVAVSAAHGDRIAALMDEILAPFEESEAVADEEESALRVAVIGRPNVGKSTLFNRLTRTRDALVADYPGLTRDRQYGYGRVGPVPYIVIDTGGIAGGEEGISELMAAQTVTALKEADAAIVMVDGRSGLTAADEFVADLARRHARSVWLVANKSEGLDAAIATAEFHALGLGEPVAVSAAHGDRIAALMDEILAPFEESEAVADEEESALRVAVVGRPNVGKSTLVNRLLGEDRVVVYDQPGTTRDSVAVPFERDGKRYVLVDTAGVRRRSRVSEAIEKFSIVKAIQAMERAQVVIAVLDAQEGVTEQDVSLMGLCLERGRALVVAVNKWDGLSADERRKVREDLDRRLPFLDFAERRTISALHGTGVGDLLPAAERAFAAATRDLSTVALNRVLADAVAAHAPPMIGSRRIRLRYAHQGGRNPPVIVVHGNQTEKLPDAYRRYLVNTFRKAFDLTGTPVRLTFKTGENPYKGRRNKLTPRQERRRKRLLKHAKR